MFRMNLLNIYQYFLIIYVLIVFLLLFLEGLNKAKFKLNNHWQFNNLLIAIYSFLGLLLKLGIVSSPSASVLQFGFVFREVGVVQPSWILGSLLLVLLPFLFFYKSVRLNRNFSIILSILLLNSIFNFKEMLLEIGGYFKGNSHEIVVYGIERMDFEAAVLVVGFSTLCWIGFFYYLDRTENEE